MIVARRMTGIVAQHLDLTELEQPLEEPRAFALEFQERDRVEDGEFLGRPAAGTPVIEQVTTRLLVQLGDAKLL